MIEILLAQRYNDLFIRKTTVDDSDLPFLSTFKWYYHPDNVVVTFFGKDKERKIKTLHCLLLDPPKNYIITHLDGDNLNNQRSNLKVWTRKEASQYLTPYPGLGSNYYGVANSRGKWAAQYKDRKGIHSLGFYSTEREAAEAYDLYMRERLGEVAILNFPL